MEKIDTLIIPSELKPIIAEIIELIDNVFPIDDYDCRLEREGIIRLEISYVTMFHYRHSPDKRILYTATGNLLKNWRQLAQDEIKHQALHISGSTKTEK